MITAEFLEKALKSPSVAACYAPDLVIMAPPTDHTQTKRERGCGSWLEAFGAGKASFQTHCDNAHCEKCGPMLADSAYKQLLVAIATGPLFIIIATDEEAKQMVRDQGKDNIWRIPFSNGRNVVFNRKDGDRIFLPPTPEDLLGWMRGRPDNRRLSGSLVRPIVDYGQEESEIKEPVTILQEVFRMTGSRAKKDEILERAQNAALDRLSEPISGEDLQDFVFKATAYAKEIAVEAGLEITWSNSRYAVCDLSVYRDLYTRRLNDREGDLEPEPARAPLADGQEYVAFYNGPGEKISLNDLAGW